MIAYLKKRVIAASLSAASVIMVLQITMLPWWLDTATDIVILGLMALVGQISKKG